MKTLLALLLCLSVMPAHADYYGSSGYRAAPRCGYRVVNSGWRSYREYYCRRVYAHRPRWLDYE